MNKNINQEIFSAVSLCNYPPNVTDYLITSIDQIMNYKYVKSKPQYKIKTINKEKIIAIRIQLDVPFNKKSYDVPIVVFFPNLIPLEPPKIFIEVSKGSAINPKIKDVEIKTRKIITPILRTWEQNTSFINILNEIRNSFSITFPIYKLKKNSQNQNINNANNTNNINNKSSSTININNNAVFNIMNNNINNINNINNNSGDPFANIASLFTVNNGNNTGNNIMYVNDNNNNNKQNMFYGKENVIKDILVEEVFDKISSKLISEYKKLNQQNKTLNNYKNQFRNENEKMEKYFTKKKDIENKCTKDLYHLNTEIKKYSEYNKKKEINKITDNNCLGFIKIESPEVIKAIANEINNEEMIIMVKKGFEKKVINFQEAIMFTREAARNLFIAKIVTEKGLKNIGKFY